MSKIALLLIFVISFSLSTGDGNNEGLLTEESREKPEMPLIGYVFSEDTLETFETVCSLIKDGVVGIFDATSRANSDVVESVCDSMDIPHVIFRWSDEKLINTTMVNLYPHASTLARVYIDIIVAFGWKQFTVLYEDNEGLSRVSDLIKLNNEKGDYSVTVQQLYRTEKQGYRTVLKDVWKLQQTNFVLDCNIESLEDIFRHAQQVGLMTNIHKYIVTNLNMQIINLEPYKYSETNITGIRMFNPKSELIQEFWIEMHNGKNNTSAEKLRLEDALMADGLSLYTKVLKKLPHVNEKKLLCNSTNSWEHGSTVVNEMRMTSIEGLTGTVSFSAGGVRTDVSLEVIELQEKGIFKVGDWNLKEGFKLFRPQYVNINSKQNTLRNASLTVIIALTDPYAMVKHTQTRRVGNDRYEGFGIDLIHELSKITGFTYTFIVRDDKSNGVKDKVTGEWTGMIGDVRNDKAQLAITDLTITAERESAVDFTVPFMNLGISILYKKASKAPPNFFSFAKPFAIEVWLCLGGAYFVVSIMLFIMGRLCPSEWTNPYPCIEEPQFLLNQFSLRNAFWFTIGSLMQQGTEIAPIAYATRMQAGVWWFFTLIMVSSYTANLAAFLATESADVPFNDVYELVARSEKASITYGAKKDGATATFFGASDSETFKHIYRYMQENEETVMVADNKDGVVKAEDKNENYAFFMESTSIEYEIQRQCTLTQINGLLDEKGYGIAMKKGSPYRNELNTAMLKLQSSGKIADLKRKWWEEQRGGGQCKGEIESQEAKPLNLKNVGGVFWVTLSGIIIAILLVFLEMVLHIMNESMKHKSSFKDELIEELKFYFKFRGLVKTVNIHRNSTESPCDTKDIVNNTGPPIGFLPDIATS